MPDLILQVSEYSRAPMGRTTQDGKGNAEEFRKVYLEPRLRMAMERGVRLVVDLQDIFGLPPSFIDEAFGRLVESMKMTADQLKRVLVIRADQARHSQYPDRIWQYIAEHDLARRS